MMRKKNYWSGLSKAVVFAAFIVGLSGLSAPSAKASIEETEKKVKRVELRQTELLKNPKGRELLKYLVSCALPEGTELYGKHQGTEYRFSGDLDLAPHWIEKGLTPEEERWVSACILARTNYFGKKVRIYMAGLPNEEETGEKEEKGFTLYEGDFFGNIFSSEKVAGVCKGDRSAREESNPILKDRICTGARSVGLTGEVFTHCGFILTGPCGNESGHSLRGESYKEYISIYLKPE